MRQQLYLPEETMLVLKNLAIYFDTTYVQLLYEISKEFLKEMLEDIDDIMIKNNCFSQKDADAIFFNFTIDEEMRDISNEIKEKLNLKNIYIIYDYIIKRYGKEYIKRHSNIKKYKKFLAKELELMYDLLIED